MILYLVSFGTIVVDCVKLIQRNTNNYPFIIPRIEKTMTILSSITCQKIS